MVYLISNMHSFLPLELEKKAMIGDWCRIGRSDSKNVRQGRFQKNEVAKGGAVGERMLYEG